MTRKVIGVLGGMGPAATAELFLRIIDNTAAETDQEHVNLVIINDPQIPDRSSYILNNGPSPIPRLLANLKKLSLAGADIAVIPCMTAHSFIRELNEASPIPVLNAISLVEEYVKDNFSRQDKIGLLATDGSIKSKVYQRNISNKIIVPNRNEQKDIMEIIYGESGIKAGNISNEITYRIKNVTDKLRHSENIKVVIAGCTELGLVMDEKNIGIPVIDPITILAQKVVQIGNNYKIKTI